MNASGIYYIGVSVSVYLLSSRYRTRLNVAVAQPLAAADWANISAFVFVVGGLIGVMAVLHLAPMFAALYVFVAVGSALVLAHLVIVARSQGWTLRALAAPLGRFIDYFASMTADLTLLLATLSIMTGALIITGCRRRSAGSSSTWPGSTSPPWRLSPSSSARCSEPGCRRRPPTSSPRS